MNFKKFFFSAVLLQILFVSCSSDDTKNNIPLGSYDNGILVLNEGGLGEVTYVSDNLQMIQHDVFATVNGESNDLGAYAQSLFFNGDRAYIISNGSNKITVVNRYSFEYIATISTGMQIPRYGVVYNGKAYITNMNDYMTGADDYISVINLADFSVETPIPINDFAERLIEYNGKLYVSGGSFGTGDKVTVVNLSNKTIEAVIAVGSSPNSLEERNGIIYVLCGSVGGASKIVKINPDSNTISGTIELDSEITNAQNLDIDTNYVYFTSAKNIYKSELTSTLIADEPLVTVPAVSPYIGYGFAVHGDRIYISEAAADFSSAGKAFVYSTTGIAIDEFQTGVGPNGFYFN